MRLRQLLSQEIRLCNPYVNFIWQYFKDCKYIFLNITSIYWSIKFYPTNKYFSFNKTKQKSWNKFINYFYFYFFNTNAQINYKIWYKNAYFITNIHKFCPVGLILMTMNLNLKDLIDSQSKICKNFYLFI